MKSVRFLLLVLLAVLLPLRGALAEATHCGAATADRALVVQQPATGHHHAHDAGPSQGGQPHVDSHHDHTDTAADDCNLCTASCSTTPFVSASPSVAAPVSIAAATYPALIAPPPSHASEGQERPPRSL